MLKLDLDLLETEQIIHHSKDNDENYLKMYFLLERERDRQTGREREREHRGRKSTERERERERAGEELYKNSKALQAAS